MRHYEETHLTGKRRIAPAELAERVGKLGLQENERNLNNKISRGGFTAGFRDVPNSDRVPNGATKRRA